MSLDALLARGRAAAEALMVDTCLIRRRTGETTDPESGQITPTYEVVYGPDIEPHRGKCRIQQHAGTASAQDAGEAHRLIQRLEVQLPMSAPPAASQVDNEVVMVASVHDPALAGRLFRIRDGAYGSHKTARRLGVSEVTS